MRKIMTIVGQQLKMFFKSPGTIVLMFVMPALFSFIFGGVAANPDSAKPVVNVVAGEGKATDEIMKLLKKNDDFSWRQVSLKAAKSNVSEQDSIAAVVIPNDIEQRMAENGPIFDVMIERKTESYYSLEPLLQGTASLIARSYQAVDPSDSSGFPQLLEMIAGNQGVSVDQQVIQKERTKQTDMNLMFVGFSIMFMMFGLSGAASAILDERAGGTWGRLLVSPAAKLQIIFGYLLSYFVMGAIQFVMLMTAMSLLFDVTWGNLSYLLPFASLVILSVVGFGLMIAALVKTKQQAAALSAVLVVSTCMLGGVYWSLDLVPDVMQKIALAVPQSWAMSGFKEIISGSLHMGTLGKDVLALVLFTILFFAVGIRGIRFE
ncbi:ABC-2 transporter permease [Neobacillus muris]|uniref:ABC-2 transporter permease n=1 Tax=Neobacillus muris TaxID=2941334 RepID=UPI00204099F4|nr:ABC transporter permease [Neobacillus muris]